MHLVPVIGDVVLVTVLAAALGAGAELGFHIESSLTVVQEEMMEEGVVFLRMYDVKAQ